MLKSRVFMKPSLDKVEKAARYERLRINQPKKPNMKEHCLARKFIYYIHTGKFGGVGI